MHKAIMENQPIGIIRLSELLNFPQHKVRYSLRILEQEGLTHLVLREVQQFGQADDADRLVLHDRLEHRHMTLEQRDLGLNLAGERTPAGHGLPPLHNVTWSVITWPSLKRSTLR